MVLCAEKPSAALLKRVSIELPIQLKKITEEHQYVVTIAAEESAVLVTDETITVKVFLTSPLLRDPQGIYLKAISVRESITDNTRFRVTSFNIVHKLLANRSQMEFIYFFLLFSCSFTIFFLFLYTKKKRQSAEK